MRNKTLPLFSATIFVSLSLMGCLVFSERRWEFRIVAGPSNATRVQVAYDSPEVRKLIAASSPAEILNMPGFTVPVKSYCSIIQRSTSKCGPDPRSTWPVYVLIKVTSGPSRGEQGWVCRAYVQQLAP